MELLILEVEVEELVVVLEVDTGGSSGGSGIVIIRYKYQ
jgi:hypothetical protein